MQSRILGTTLALVGVPLLLTAQVARTTYAGDGEGRLLTGDARATQQITRVEAILYQNGGLELGLFKGRTRWVFMGNWSGDPGTGSVGIRLDEALDRAAEGSGRLYLERSRLDRIRFTGSNRDGRFEFSFESRAPTDDSESRRSAAGEVATTRNGEGSILADTVQLPLTRARVRLQKNGRAQIRLWGSELHALDGRWTGDLAAESVRLSVSEWEGRDADLRGTLSRSRRNGWDEIRLAGPSDRGPVKLEFKGKGSALEYDNTGPRVSALERTMRGTGTVTVDGRSRDEAVVVRIHLQRDWGAVVQIQGAKERFAFQGTWLQRGEEPKLSLDLTSGSLGRGTLGSGTLEMQAEDRWRVLSLSGRTATGTWAVGFRAAEPVRLLFDPGDEGAPALVSALVSEVAGAGSLTLPAQRGARAIRRLRVSLQANRDAEITILEGDTTATLTGRWSPGERRGRVDIAVTGGSLKGFRGTGKVELSEALAVTRVVVDGRVVTLRTRLEFTAGSGGPPRSTAP